MRELDHKESWAPKNRCFWTVVLEKTLESPLDCKEIKLVNPKGNQSWILSGRIDVEAGAPIFWPPVVKKLTHWKRPWCWERLKAGRGGDIRGRDGWMASLTWWASLSKLLEVVKDKEAWPAAVRGVTNSRTLLSDWTITIHTHTYF